MYYVLCIIDIPNQYRLVWDIKWGKSVLSARKVPQFDGDLGLNISHKNESYDKNLYTMTNGMDSNFSLSQSIFSKMFF